MTNFDRWEADPFFSATKDVQESADRFESADQIWVSVRSVTDTDPNCSDNLGNSVVQLIFMALLLDISVYIKREVKIARTTLPLSLHGHAGLHTGKN